MARTVPSHQYFSSVFMAIGIFKIDAKSYKKLIARIIATCEIGLSGPKGPKLRIFNFWAIFSIISGIGEMVKKYGRIEGARIVNHFGVECVHF